MGGGGGERQAQALCPEMQRPGWDRGGGGRGCAGVPPGLRGSLCRPLSACGLFQPRLQRPLLREEALAMPPRHVHDHTRECLQVAVLDPGGPSLRLSPMTEATGGRRGPLPARGALSFGLKPRLCAPVDCAQGRADFLSRGAGPLTPHFGHMGVGQLPGKCKKQGRWGPKAGRLEEAGPGAGRRRRTAELRSLPPPSHSAPRLVLRSRTAQRGRSGCHRCAPAVTGEGAARQP